MSDEVATKIIENNINSIRKTNETQKPIIVHDVTFPKSSPAVPTAPRVLYSEPITSRDIGNDPSLGSISFPPGNDLLDIITGNQCADQFAVLTVIIKDYFEQMTNSFVNLTTSVSSIESRLKEIEMAININATARTNPNQFADIIAAMPFATKVDAMKFEANIKTDEDRHRVVTYLSQVGGNCAKECIRRLLSKVFSISLANTSSWQGQLGNFKVSELKIIGIIKDAVRVSYACTDKFYEDEGEEWFRQGTQKYKRAHNKAVAIAAASDAILQNDKSQLGTSNDDVNIVSTRK